MRTSFVQVNLSTASYRSPRVFLVGPEANCGLYFYRVVNYEIERKHCVEP